MDIAKYKMYVRDANITDIDFTQLIKDVIEDIARDTKVFKELFGFTVEACMTEYDMRLMFNLHSAVKRDKISSITLSSDYDPSSTIDYINSITIDKEDTEFSCETTRGIEVKVDMVTEEGTVHKYLSLLDVVQIYDTIEDIDEYGVSTPVRSILDNYMKNLNGSIYIKDIVKLRAMGLDETKGYSIPVVGIASIVPNTDEIDSDMEDILKQAIIAGLKYFVSDMYMNVSNEQVSNILYQRYYSKKKQLRDDYPQYVSDILPNNANWNN